MAIIQGEVTQPNWHRTAKNVSAAVIVKNVVVKRGAARDEALLPAAVTDQPWGVTTEDLPIGGTRSIQVEGVALIKVSAAIAIHARVQAGTDGRIATAATNSAIVGQALAAAAAADDIIPVELWKGRFIEP
jgi:hypothetical protein